MMRAGPNKAASSTRILIVEDEPAMVAGLRDNFEYEGYEVISAGDGAAGLERALAEEPVAAPQTVQAFLENHGARHVVIGHTPTHGAIWPRYSGQVIQADTGMSASYGGHVAWLEETKDGLFAGYPSGKVRLPSDDAGRVGYLKQVIALQPGNAGLQTQLSALEQAANGNDGETNKTAETTQGGTGAASAPAALPICGISP